MYISTIGRRPSDGNFFFFVQYRLYTPYSRLFTSIVKFGSRYRVSLASSEVIMRGVIQRTKVIKYDFGVFIFLNDHGRIFGRLATCYAFDDFCLV